MPGGGGGQVRFQGRPIGTRPRETLTQALFRRGAGLLRRSVRYHRPRGPFCGVGYCTGCLVRVNGEPNVRACRYEPSEGDRVEIEGGWPSARFDLFALLDRLGSNGFDSHHAFTRPGWAAPLYQRAVRSLTGLARLGDAERPRRAPDGTSMTTETLVIGAGTSGSALVRALGPLGPSTLLLDRDRLPVPIPGAAVRERCTVVFLPPPVPSSERPFRAIALDEDGGAVRVRACRVVLACGGYDASLLFAGNDRPGVFTADGALSSALAASDPPFRRAVIVGGGARALELLERFGPFVEAIVAPGSVGPDVARRASELGIEIFPRTLVLRTVGGARVRGVRLARRGEGPEFGLDGDAIVLAHRRLPNAPLFFQAGARMQWRSETGAYYPVLARGSETTVPGLFAIGTAAGFVGPAAVASARSAADALLGVDPPSPVPARVGADGPNELEGYYRELLGRPGRRGKTVACPCEDVLLPELAGAARAGYRGIEVVKRYTSLGTGVCQGRYCLPDALLLLAIWEGRSPPEVGYIRQRPPVVPAPLAALAGLPEEPGAATP